jgi:16S rRNA processing protein RimM
LAEVFSENLLLLGKVIRPHGLNGLLRIISYSGSKESFLNAGTLFLKPEKAGLSEHKLTSITTHKNAFLLRLNGVDTLDVAETYRGAEILIRKDTLRRESDDEYFWFELIGLEVYLDSGQFIGKLHEIINTGSNDIYIVKEGNKEFLIPAIHGIVLKVDLENKKIVIADNIEGLLNINEV